MNAGSETLLVGNALEKSGQLLTLLWRQRCTQRFVVLLSDPADFLECRLPLLGQVQLICSPIVKAILPLRQAALFQLINDRHQATWVHVEHLGQSLLTQPAGSPEYSKDARMWWRETQRRKSLREFTSSVRSHLSYQEGRGRRSLSSTGICHARLQLHIPIVYDINDYTINVTQTIPIRSPDQERGIRR